MRDGLFARLGRRARSGRAARCGDQSAASADLGHSSSIGGDAFATFAARVAGLVGGELVGSALEMSGTATLASDLSLLVGIHRRKSAVLSAGSHNTPFLYHFPLEGHQSKLHTAVQHSPRPLARTSEVKPQ